MLLNWIRWPFGNKTSGTSNSSSSQAVSPKSSIKDDANSEYDARTPFLEDYASASHDRLAPLQSSEPIAIAIKPSLKTISTCGEDDSILPMRRRRKWLQIPPSHHINVLIILCRWSSMIAMISLAFVLILVALGWPRETAFNIESFDINPENSTYYDDDNRLITNWLATISIANHNFYPLNIDEMQVIVYLEDDRRQPIGKGFGKKLAFPARSRSLGRLEFQMPVYAPSTGLPSLIGECMSHPRVNLFLQAKVDFSWSHWSGYWVPWELHAAVDCKIPVDPSLS